MRKKLSGEDVLRLMYESYTRHMNEEQENVVPQEYKRLVDFAPKIEGGRLMLYINVHEPELFGVLPQIVTGEGGIISDIENERARKGLPPMTRDERRAKIGEFLTGMSKNNDTEYIKVPICDIGKLGSIFDEDGKVIDSAAYKSVVNNILRILRKLEKYNFAVSDEQVQSMFKTIFFYGKRLPSEKDIAEINNNVDELFFRLCNTLGEDETKKLLNTIHFSKDNVVTDHQLNFNNKLRIIAQAEKYDEKGANQLNTISYFATQRQWMKMGRIVVDFSYPYHLDVFHGGRGDEKGEDEILQKRGMKMTSGFRGRKARNIATNAELYGMNGFSYHIFFDVSATMPVNGVQDKFMTEPGMVNNMTGELNDIAQQEIQKMGFSDDSDINDRTSKLNQIFGTTDYEGVDLTYEATCMAFGQKPNPNMKNNTKAEIAEVNEMIRNKLIQWAEKKSGGGIAKAANYQPLISIGMIMIQGLIGLPMDNASQVKITDEYKEMAKSMREPINTIAMDILNSKKKIISQGNQTDNVNEMFNLYSNMFIFEELFNKTINLLTENAQI